MPLARRLLFPALAALCAALALVALCYFQLTPPPVASYSGPGLTATPAPSALSTKLVHPANDTPTSAPTDIVIIEPETASPDNLEAERETVRRRMAELSTRTSQLRQQFHIEDSDPESATSQASIPTPQTFTANIVSDLDDNKSIQVAFSKVLVSSKGAPGNTGSTTIQGGTFNFTAMSGELTSADNTLVLTSPLNDNGTANTASSSLVITSNGSGSLDKLSGLKVYALKTDQEKTGNRPFQLLSYYHTDTPADPARGLRDYQTAKSDYLAAKEQLGVLEHRLQISHLNPLPPERVKDWRRQPSLEASPAKP